MTIPACPYALFDLDGTLVDSMAHWKRLPLAFFASHGLSVNEAERNRLLASHGYGEILDFCRERGVNVTLPELMEFLHLHMVDAYEREIPLKAGALPLLHTLRDSDCKMGLITMTPHRDAEVCLARHGLSPFFSFVLTPEDMPDGSGKEEPEIFELALEKLGGARPGECLFFEDSLYAVETASKMGFRIMAVKDVSAAYARERIDALAEQTLDLDAPPPEPNDFCGTS